MILAVKAAMSGVLVISSYCIPTGEFLQSENEFLQNVSRFLLNLGTMNSLK
jgi:hypothetical protein